MIACADVVFFFCFSFGPALYYLVFKKYIYILPSDNVLQRDCRSENYTTNTCWTTAKIFKFLVVLLCLHVSLGCLSVCLFVLYFFLSVYMPACLYIRLPTCPSVCIPDCLVCLLNCLPVCLFVFLSVGLPLRFSLSAPPPPPYDFFLLFSDLLRFSGGVDVRCGATGRDVRGQDETTGPNIIVENFSLGYS